MEMNSTSVGAFSSNYLMSISFLSILPSNQISNLLFPSHAIFINVSRDNVDLFFSRLFFSLFNLWLFIIFYFILF